MATRSNSTAQPFAYGASTPLRANSSAPMGGPLGEWPRPMRDLVNGHTVECEARGKDKYGRTIGLCNAGGVDIQAETVKAGKAWAFIRYSHDYILREGEAQAANLGVHAHNCLLAWK